MEQNNKSNISKQAKRAVSLNSNISKALQEIKAQLGDEEFNLILFFASPTYPPGKISKEFQQTFPNVQTIGCTTAGEIFGGELLQDSIVAMAFNKNIIKNFHIELINNINELMQVNKAFQVFAKDLGVKTYEMDSEKYVGIILADGLKGEPENLISRINEITEIPFIGGTAGDNWELKHSYIYINGKYYENAALIILLEPTNGFKILKTQSFEPLGAIFIATAVDEKKRCLKTVDNKPAALFYAQQIGVPIEELKEQFPNYSIGQIIYDEAYLHDSVTFDDKYNLYLHSSIPKGAEIQILKISNIIEDMERIIEQEIKPLENISAIVNFNCGSRFLKLKKENQETEFQQLFKDLPAIGFATYGEFFISFINQTSVMLVLF